MRIVGCEVAQCPFPGTLPEVIGLPDLPAGMHAKSKGAPADAEAPGVEASAASTTLTA